MDLADPTTFARAYDDHARSVYGAAMRILGDPARAQDVTQDVFLRVWRNPARFDSRRGELGGYLRLMARSRALDLWREGQAAGRARDRLELVVAGDEAVRTDERPSVLVERDADRAVVRDALARLPEPQREAVTLKHLEGRPLLEVANVMNRSPASVASLLRRGLAALRELLAENTHAT